MKLLRSLLRITGATVVLLVLLSSTTYFGLRTYGHHRLQKAIDAFTQQRGPLDPAAYALEPVPNHRNAAVWWQQAAAKVYLVNRRSDAVSLAAVSPEQSWQPWMREQIIPALEENAEAMPLFHFAAALPEMNFQLEYGNGSGASSTPIIGLLSGARLLAVTARMHHAEGRRTETMRCMRTIGRMATALENEVDVVLQLAGWTIEGILLHLTAEMACGDQLSSQEARHLLDQIPVVDVEQNFALYLGWEVASAVPLVVATDHGEWQWQEWAESTGKNHWDRLTEKMTRELRTALELEAHLRATRGLDRPATELMNSPLEVDPPGLPNPTLFVGRMQAVITSRRVVRTALELRLRIIDIGGETPTEEMPSLAAPVTGGHISVQPRSGGGWRVEAPGSEEIAAKLFPSRINPPPPLMIMVPAAVIDAAVDAPYPPHPFQEPR